MNVGFQDFWLTGARVYFQRDPVTVAGSPVVQPIIDFGRVEVVSPSVAVSEVELNDADGGIERVVAKATNKVSESYEVKCSNLNMDMLNLLFSGNGATGFTQAATPVTDVAHVASPGRLVKLMTSTGVFVYGVTSIQDVKKASTPLVLGTDYQIISLERGLISILATSAVVTTANTAITISYTPRVISSTENRLINPQMVNCTMTGAALIVWGRCGNRQQTVREMKVSVAPTAAAFDVQKWSEMTLRLSVLSDPTLPTPAGRLLYWLGDMAVYS